MTGTFGWMRSIERRLREWKLFLCWLRGYFSIVNGALLLLMLDFKFIDDFGLTF